MQPAAYLMLAMFLVVVASIGLIQYVSHRRIKQGKKPRAGLMAGGLIAVLVIGTTIVEFSMTSPVQAERAKEPAIRLMAALTGGDLASAKSLLTPEFAQRVDLQKWRLHPDTSWEIAGRDTAKDAPRLFYLTESGPADRQTLYISFEKRDGRMLVSDLQRVYHLPRPVLELGKRMVRSLAEGKSLTDQPEFSELDEAKLRKLAAGLQALKAASQAELEPEAKKFRNNVIQSIGRTQLPARMWVDWQVAAGGETLSFHLTLQYDDGWRATQLKL